MSLTTLLLLIIGFLLGLFVKDYLPSYMRKKAENLATKEDIHEITKIQEDIKKNNQIELENIKGELLKSSNLFVTTMNSLSISRQAFNTYISSATNEIWKCAVDISNNISFLATLTDMCNLMPELKEDWFKKGNQEITTKTDQDAILELTAIFNKTELHKIFISEALYTSLLNYVSFAMVFKMLARKAIKDNKILNLREDIDINELFRRTLPKALIGKIYQNAFYAKNCSLIYHQIIIANAQKEITGKDFSEASIEQAINIESQYTELTKKNPIKA
jgi:hypothetical protein